MCRSGGRRRARPPTCRWRTATRARPTSSIARAVLRSSRWLEDLNTPRSATTSSTTRTCSRNHGIALRGMRLRLDARVLRAEQHGDASRHGLAGGALPRHADDSLRRRRRQRRQADCLRRRPIWTWPHPMPPKTPTSRCGCIACAVAAAEKDTAAGHRSTRRSSSRWCRCWPWKSTACCSTRQMLRSRARSSGGKWRSSRQQAHAKPGKPFNLDSPKQLQDILFEKLQLPVMRKTPKGQPSTAEDVLEELAADYQLPTADSRATAAGEAQVHLHRQAARADQCERTGRVHTCYHQAVAATGPAVIVGSQPAEHSDPHAPKAGVFARRSLRRRPGSLGGRLLADRAAHHGAPVRRRRVVSRVRQRPRHPPGHGRRGVRRGAG